MNKLIYKIVRRDAETESIEVLKQKINYVLQLMTDQINKEGKSPNEEQLDRIEATLKALKDVIAERSET